MSRTTRASKVINTMIAPVVKGRDDPERTWADTVVQVEQEMGAQDTAYADSLGILLRSIAEEPRLTPLGWRLALIDLRGRYTNRLRVRTLHEAHPEIGEEPLASPVFVLGLPRTATTLTHRVLAASPAHRGPLLWEMGWTELENPALARRQIAVMDRGSKIATALLAPDMKFMHPTGAALPEESFWLLPHGTFWSGMYGSLPAYNEWYAGRSADGLAGDYEFLKQALQVLQHGRDRKRWILKYPGHLNDMATIRQVFPEATFVWTHRDPATVVGSACSLVETGWAMYQRDPDPLEVGRVVPEQMSTWLRNALEARLTLPSSAIVDVPYHRLSAHPHSEVPRLYAAIGATWTPTDAEHLDQLVVSPGHTRRHRYDVSRFGLTPEGIREMFSDYVDLLQLIDAVDARPAADL